MIDFTAVPWLVYPATPPCVAAMDEFVELCKPVWIPACHEHSSHSQTVTRLLKIACFNRSRQRRMFTKSVNCASAHPLTPCRLLADLGSLSDQACDACVHSPLSHRIRARRWSCFCRSISRTAIRYVNRHTCALRTAHSAQEAGTDSFVSCWLLQWVLDVAVRMLLLGFELALYQPHEHFMIYWWVCVLECIRSRLQVP